VGKLPRYPVPEFRLKQGAGRLLLDIGCNWGRWCLAAAKEGFIPVGIDPQFGAVVAAQRVAKQLGVEAYFVCGDARYLPFRRCSFDTVFSYSVLQHLSRSDVREAAAAAAAVMKAGAEFMIQMPTRCGLRNLIQQARRGFADGTGFDVRYWNRRELRAVFEAEIGPLEFEVDCFFGIGLQPADADLLPPTSRLLIRLSEALRRLRVLTPLADSLYLHGSKTTKHLN
jgi:SAM-dependent methyltransferase